MILLKICELKRIHVCMMSLIFGFSWHLFIIYDTDKMRIHKVTFHKFHNRFIAAQK